MPADADLTDDLALAQELASAAAEIALDGLRRGVQADRKADGTEVTEADLGVERHLVEQLRQQRPDDAILGEEFGQQGGSGLGTQGASRRRWILDPIDGTANYVSGKPQWGTHVALERDGEIVLGVITRPAIGQRWWATRGGGAHRLDEGSPGDVKPLRVSTNDRLAESRIAVWADASSDIAHRVRAHALCAPCDLDAILELAEGRFEAVIDPTGKPWDHAPAVVLVEEAGGRFSDNRSGHRHDVGEGRFSNGAIHEALVRILDDGSRS